jgi:hypothetical protein
MDQQNGSMQKGCLSDVNCTSGTFHTLAEDKAAERMQWGHTEELGAGRHTAAQDFGHRICWIHSVQ